LSSIGHHAPSYSEHDTCTRLTREVQYEIPSNVLARYASQPLFDPFPPFAGIVLSPARVGKLLTWFSSPQGKPGQAAPGAGLCRIKFSAANRARPLGVTRRINLARRLQSVR